MTRLEIRRRALYSAATVTLTMGFLGCAASVEIDPEVDEAASPAEPVAPPATHAAPTATAAKEPGGPLSAVIGEPAPKKCVVKPGDAGWTDYENCCAMNNWDPASGCEAWGPPMPPAMEVA